MEMKTHKESERDEQGGGSAVTMGPALVEPGWHVRVCWLSSARASMAAAQVRDDRIEVS